MLEFLTYYLDKYYGETASDKQILNTYKEWKNEHLHFL